MTKYNFSTIALMWRPSSGERRIHIGTISVDKRTEQISFCYNNDGVRKAKEISSNFQGYPGLPLNDITFSSELLKEVFFRRLIDINRNDANDFLDFWLVDKNRLTDPIYLLAQTQGLSFSDMFEFVPKYYVSHNSSFITDIAGLSKTNFDIANLSKGQILNFKKEPENIYDTGAVYVCYNGIKIGYIKQGHNSIFARKNPKNITLTIWEIVNFPNNKKLYIRVDIHR